ncbi:MAG: type II toxin-antitoxin system HicA family toxin [Treponema sp.]|nr:type II toxin-antitoxin system HicA family toxin [Treponema sp.]
MKKSEFEKALRKAGCFLAQHGKRHDKWTNPATGKSERVPRHAGEIPTGTALKILKNLAGE